MSVNLRGVMKRSEFRTRCVSVLLSVGAFVLPAAGQVGGWSPTGNMTQPRCMATATLLTTGIYAGQTMIAGGTVPVGYTSTTSAEVYNPATGAYVQIAPMRTARYYHTATLLQDGKVLIAGGALNGLSGSIADAELFDPATGTFSPAAPMNVGRYVHTATLLPGGTVLVTGGAQTSGALASAELYVPPSLAGNSTGTWLPLGNMHAARHSHSASLLPDGTVLIAGGTDGQGHSLTSAEVFDPDRGFVVTGSMHYGRAFHTGTSTATGAVIIGGWNWGTGSDVAPAEVYTINPLSNSAGTSELSVVGPKPGAFTVVGSLNYARDQHRATTLASGAILVTGGSGAVSPAMVQTEIWSPKTRTFTVTGSMAVPRYNHTATLLPNGKVLAAGGCNYTSDRGITGQSELYGATGGSF